MKHSTDVQNEINLSDPIVEEQIDVKKDSNAKTVRNIERKGDEETYKAKRPRKATTSGSTVSVALPTTSTSDPMTNDAAVGSLSSDFISKRELLDSSAFDLPVAMKGEKDREPNNCDEIKLKFKLAKEAKTLSFRVSEAIDGLEQQRDVQMCVRRYQQSKVSLLGLCELLMASLKRDSVGEKLRRKIGVVRQALLAAQRLASFIEEPTNPKIVQGATLNAGSSRNLYSNSSGTAPTAVCNAKQTGTDGDREKERGTLLPIASMFVPLSHSSASPPIFSNGRKIGTGAETEKVVDEVILKIKFLDAERTLSFRVSEAIDGLERQKDVQRCVCRYELGEVSLLGLCEVLLTSVKRDRAREKLVRKLGTLHKTLLVKNAIDRPKTSA
jgi:hypothetical protein